jgi:hypothetical protein
MVPERCRRLGAGLVAPTLVVGVLAGGVACSGAPGADGARRAEIARRGAEVMPFDLDATTHTFRKTAWGGVQVVEADDPSDRAQRALVRAHLRRERERFAVGDFTDPARIHGMDMPGVAELRDGHDRVDVAYRAREGGAELRYRSADPRLVAAIHAWFDRQVTDHGAHARSG